MAEPNVQIDRIAFLEEELRQMDSHISPPRCAPGQKLMRIRLEPVGTVAEVQPADDGWRYVVELPDGRTLSLDEGELRNFLESQP